MRSAIALCLSGFMVTGQVTSAAAAEPIDGSAAASPPTPTRPTAPDEWSAGQGLLVIGTGLFGAMHGGTVLANAVARFTPVLTSGAGGLVAVGGRF
jgi:hypothetical protein